MTSGQHSSPRFNSDGIATAEAPPTALMALEQAIRRSTHALLNAQHADGHFCAELEGDTILESEYILLLAFLGKGQSDEAIAAARYLLEKQNPDGGWSNFPGGPTDVSCAAKAYLALKITGHDPLAEYMVRAREAVIRAGGVEKVNSFTRYYFAMLGMIPYHLCPAVPPELILFPSWFPFNVYQMSAWSRTIVVPLSLLWAFKPVTILPKEHGLDELFANPLAGFSARIQGINQEQNPGFFSWTRFFHRVDAAIKACERWNFKPLRPWAVKRCETWILDRLPQSDGLGAIFPPIVWTLIGLKAMGYADDHPAMQQQYDELAKLMIHEGGSLRLQPCMSPVWDTAISMIALADAGLPPHHPSMKRAVKWLLSKEVRSPGDWSIAHPDVEPGGWYFEYNNEFYPDVDDTAMVLIALSRGLPEGTATAWKENETSHEGNVLLQTRAGNTASAIRDLEESLPALSAIRRGVRWLKAMQSRDGGWGAFDSDINKEFLTRVPFADHNAMLDETNADITARIVECFAHVGVPLNDPSVQKALAYVWADQEPDHAWFGRWGVNYLYGTWQVLVGLIKAGIPANDVRLQRAAGWLKKVQQPCGGWGETPATYDHPELRGTGDPTASQTAWAILGLIAAGEANSPECQRGIQYLLKTQSEDGTWDEPQFTGTGFPRVFYLRYHFYPLYFPLMALARYTKARGLNVRLG